MSVVLAAEPAEAEQLVDGALELERLALALFVVLGDGAQPVGAHLHVGDLVGEHPVLAEVEDGVTGQVAEVAHRVEHVDGEALELSGAVRGVQVDPPAGRAFLDRARLRPGMITPDGPVVAAFAARGWGWGGRWSDLRDYHHFSRWPRGPQP